MVLDECKFQLIFSVLKILEELQRDPWPVPSDQRAARCTGTALNLAAHLLGACVPGSGARIMAFLGGPTTEGSGTVSAFALLIILRMCSSVIASQFDLSIMLSLVKRESGFGMLCPIMMQRDNDKSFNKTRSLGRRHHKVCLSSGIYKMFIIGYFVSCS